MKQFILMSLVFLNQALVSNASDFALAQNKDACMQATQDPVMPAGLIEGVKSGSHDFGEFDYYALGFDPKRPLFQKTGSQENSRNFRMVHPVGIQGHVSGSKLMFSVYAIPTSRKYTAPFGDSPSQITDKNLARGGFAIAYPF